MNRKLENRFLNYFTLVVVAACVIAIEFFYEMNSSRLFSEICGVPLSESDQLATQPIVHLRNKIAIMLGLLTIVVAIIMMMFIKNIALPLKRMALTAEKINEGDLTNIVTIEHQDEIGLVGTAINELTSNLQEVAAITSSTVQQAIGNVEQIEQRIRNNSQVSFQDIDDLKSQLKTLNDFIGSFQLLQADINNDS